MSDAFAAPARRTFSPKRNLRAFAARSRAGLRPGDVVALSGPLGAGKTTFVRAIVEALHGADQTTSPTFTFRHRYAGAPPVDHLDLYRIEDPAENVELGLEDAFDGRSIVLVEWWRNAPDLLPAARYEVDIEGAGDAPRIVERARTRMNVLRLDGALGAFSVAAARDGVPAGSENYGQRRARAGPRPGCRGPDRERRRASGSSTALRSAWGPGGFTGLRIAVAYASRWPKPGGARWCPFRRSISWNTARSSSGCSRSWSAVRE